MIIKSPEVPYIAPDGDNTRPEANAGPDQVVDPGDMVTLDGGHSMDVEGMVTYSWARTGGTEGVTAPQLTGATTPMPTFTADMLDPGADDVTHVFTLTVTDENDATDTDTVIVTVTASNAAPIANAGGDRTVVSRATVTLYGSGTDGDGTVVSYAWERTGGSGDSAVTLTGEATAELRFEADLLAPGAADVTHMFELVVTDNEDAKSVVAPVTVTVTSPFLDLDADAGDDQSVVSGATVTLDGSGSTKDRRRTIHYAWERTGRTSQDGVHARDAVTLTNADTAMPTFTADTLEVGAADVTHVFTLTVRDNQDRIDTDTVTVTVKAPEAPEAPFANPVADAGTDRKVRSGTVVTLDGSGSTVDLRRTDKSKSYSWTRSGGTGDDTVTLTGATTAMPTFTAETLTTDAPDVTHVFTLTVTDSANETDIDTVTITVTLGNADPVADAGDDQLTVPSSASDSTKTITLDGSGSTVSEGFTAIYSWARTGGTTGASVRLSSTSAEMPTFTYTVPPGYPDVTHVFTLTVTDDDDQTDTDTVTVKVIAPVEEPVANAGLDQTVHSGESVTLDGRFSTKDYRKGLTYAWTRTGGTTGGSVNLTDANTARPSFTADTLAPAAANVTHIFTLTVTDDDNQADTDMVTITVTGDTVPPTGRFESPPTHDGKTPFTVTLVFDEKVEVDQENLVALLLDVTGTGIPTENPVNGER